MVSPRMLVWSIPKDETPHTHGILSGCTDTDKRNHYPTKPQAVTLQSTLPTITTLFKVRSPKSKVCTDASLGKLQEILQSPCHRRAWCQYWHDNGLMFTMLWPKGNKARMQLLKIQRESNRDGDSRRLCARKHCVRGMGTRPMGVARGALYTLHTVQKQIACRSESNTFC